MNQSRTSPGTDLARRAIRGALLFVVVLWLLIFVPAGSLAYWRPGYEAYRSSVPWRLVPGVW